MEEIIDDILPLIFGRISSADLCLFRGVCQRWYTTIMKQCKPITWRGEYRQRVREGDIISISTKSAKRYLNIKYIKDAVQSGSWDMIQYFVVIFRQNLKELDGNHGVLNAACKYGHFDIVKRLYNEYHIPFNTYTSAVIAASGNTKMMKWFLRKKGVVPELQPVSFGIACECGHYKMSRIISGQLDDPEYDLSKCCHGGNINLIRRALGKHFGTAPHTLWYYVGINGTSAVIELVSAKYPIQYPPFVEGLIKSGHLNLVQKYSSHVTFDGIYVRAARDKDTMEYVLRHTKPESIGLGWVVDMDEIAPPLCEMILEYSKDVVTNMDIALIMSSAVSLDYRNLFVKCISLARERKGMQSLTRLLTAYKKDAECSQSYGIVDLINGMIK